MDSYTPLDGNSNILIGYKIILGSRGVFGAKLDGRDVAVKRVLPADMSKREIEIMIRSPSHENIVRYIRSYGSKTTPDWFIFMELCKKSNLYKIVKENIHLKLNARKTILLHVAFGLQHLHENGILHRDLKPHNVLLSMDSRNIKICDFGLSKTTPSADKSVTKSKSVVGTEGWLSPESCVGRTTSVKSDIYSAGLLFYFVLSNGKCPFEDIELYRSKVLDSSASLNPDWRPLECGFEKNEEILSKCLVESMLKRDPDSRPDISKVLSHPFFWKLKKRITFMLHLKDSMDASSTCSHLEENWIGRLELDETEKLEFSSDKIDLLPKIAADLKPENMKERPEHTFLSLMRHCISDYKRKDESGGAIFSSKEQIWKFFFSKFPEVIMKAYDSIYDLPESASEGFADFKEPPTKNYLEPEPEPVSGLEWSLHDDASIHLKWQAPPKHVATYVIVTHIDGVEQNIQEIKEEKLSVRPIKYSVTYIYTVNARNSQGMNGDAVQTTDIITPPDAPKNVTINQDTSKICLAWAKPENDYRVTYYVRVKAFEYDSKTAKKDYEVEADGHEFALESPLPSVKYYFEVYGKNSFSKEGKSCSHSIITGPSRIVNVKALIVNGTGKIKVSWDSPSQDRVTYSCVTYCEGKKHREIQGLTLAEMELPETTASKEYYFEVWAKNLFGVEGSKTRSTIVYTPPEVLGNVQVDETMRQFVISWDKSDSAYCIQVLCDDEKVGGVQIIPEPQYMFTSPEQNKSYRFQVWARNRRGVDGLHITTGPYTLGPTPVRAVSATRKDSGIVVQWQADDHEEMKHLYLVQLYCDGSVVGEQKSTFSLKCTYPHLRLLKTYFVRVWVEVEGKKSEYVQSGNVFMSHEAGEICGLQVDYSSRGIHVRWKKTAGDIEHYRIRIISSEKNEREQMDIVKESIYDFLSCSPSQEYKFDVEALDYDGICIEKGTTAPQTAPPAKLKHVNIKETKGVFHLWWDPEDFISKYEVESFCSGKSECREDVMVPQYWYRGNHAKRYFFKITAINHKGLRGPTLRTPTTTIAPAKLSGIKIVHSRVENVIKLCWNPANEQVIYHIEILSDKNPSGELHETEEMVFVFTNPKPSTKYMFHIWARNLSNVDGRKSEAVCCTPPSTPSNPMVSMQGGEMVLSWEWPYDEEVENFEIQTIRKGRGLYQTHTLQRQIVVKWVAPSKEHRFEVVALSNGVRGEVASTVSSVSPPSEIRKVKCILGNRIIRVKWESAANENVHRYHYEIFCEKIQTGESCATDKCKLDVPTECSKSYYVNVWAENEAGVCGPKVSSNCIFTPPGPVKSLQVSTTDSHVNVSWSPSKGELTYLVQEYCNGQAVGYPRKTIECNYSTKAKSLTKYYFSIWAQNQYEIEGPKTRSSTINTAAVIQTFNDDQTILRKPPLRKRSGIVRRVLIACSRGDDKPKQSKPDDGLRPYRQPARMRQHEADIMVLEGPYGQ